MATTTQYDDWECFENWIAIFKTLPKYQKASWPDGGHATQISKKGGPIGSNTQTAASGSGPGRNWWGSAKAGRIPRRSS